MRYEMILGIIVLIAVFFVAVKRSDFLSKTGNAQGEGKSTYQKITAKEVKQKLDAKEKMVLVDVRTKGEYDMGHIKGSIHIPLDTIGTQPPKKLSDKESQIVVYCQSGSRSKHAAKRLLSLGYTKVFDMGALMRWPYGVVK